MIHNIHNKIYLVEVLPPKQDSENLELDLNKFCTRYRKIIDNIINPPRIPVATKTLLLLFLVGSVCFLEGIF